MSDQIRATYRELLCYMNMPSIQQEAFYRALAARCQLKVIYSGGLSADRAQLGWQPSLEGYKYLFESDRPLREKLLLQPDVFHFLSGFPGSILNLLRAALVSSRQPFAIQSEMPTPEGRTRLWKLASRAYVRVLAKKAAAVLGIGEAARRYFKQIGVSYSRLFPFAYFTLVQKTACPDRMGPIVYVGQLVKRKGVDLLLLAFAKSREARSKGLIIIGAGEEMENLLLMTSQLSLTKDVSFLGPKESNEIGDYISKASCLVLPSRYDGWGVVVNEALLLGIPAVVSDTAGASELVHYGQCGFTVRSNEVDDLALAIEKLSSSAKVWTRMSERAQIYSQRITPEAGASYFLSIVEFVQNGFAGSKPRPPWFN